MPNHPLALILASAWVFTAAGAQPAAPSAEIRVIIQGDDMGAAHAIDLGTIRAYKEGILRATNVIIPGPWLLEAARMVNENPGLDVGVHLAVTSEWSSIKWRPLTHAPSLVDGNGYFYPMIWPSKNFPAGSALREAKPDTADLEKELRAQIETARRLMPWVCYLSTHMGFATANPDWQTLLDRLSKEYKLPFPGKELGLRSLGVSFAPGADGRFVEAKARADRLIEKLEGIGPGNWMMVEHAAEDDAEMRAIGHPGYENVAADRAAVLGAWTDARVLEVVRRRNIRLCGYRELMNPPR